MMQSLMISRNHFAAVHGSNSIIPASGARGLWYSESAIAANLSIGIGGTK
jgi:hypothetical protein